jgi:hypothetical protein
MLANRYLDGADLPVTDRVPLASSNTARTSLIPTSVALSSLNIAPVCLAKIRASVVFPQLRNIERGKRGVSCSRKAYPGGPHKIIDPTGPVLMVLVSNESGPVRCDCPTNSARQFGRSRSASGAAAFKFDETLPLFAGRSLVVGSGAALLAFSEGLEDGNRSDRLLENNGAVLELLAAVPTTRGRLWEGEEPKQPVSRW